MIFEISELEMLTIRKVGRMIGSVVKPLHVWRSWYRYIFATPQGNGLILPCLALLRPHKGRSVSCSVGVLYSTK